MFFTPAPATYLRRAAVSPLYHAADRQLERFLHDMGQASARPAQQFEQTETGWTARLDIPGVAKNHLQVSIEGKRVRIETTADAARSVRLAYEMPTEIDAGASEARLEDGVLTLKLAARAASTATFLSIG